MHHWHRLSGLAITSSLHPDTPTLATARTLAHDMKCTCERSAADSTKEKVRPALSRSIQPVPGLTTIPGQLSPPIISITTTKSIPRGPCTGRTIPSQSTVRRPLLPHTRVPVTHKYNAYSDMAPGIAFTTTSSKIPHSPPSHADTPAPKISRVLSHAASATAAARSSEIQPLMVIPMDLDIHPRSNLPARGPLYLPRVDTRLNNLPSQVHGHAHTPGPMQRSSDAPFMHKHEPTSPHVAPAITSHS